MYCTASPVRRDEGTWSLDRRRISHFREMLGRLQLHLWGHTVWSGWPDYDPRCSKSCSISDPCGRTGEGTEGQVGEWANVRRGAGVKW
jgi:hypothetical protein